MRIRWTRPLVNNSVPGADFASPVTACAAFAREKTCAVNQQSAAATSTFSNRYARGIIADCRLPKESAVQLLLRLFFVDQHQRVGGRALMSLGGAVHDVAQDPHG